MTLRALLNLRDDNKKTAIDYITNNESVMDLYKNYQIIKKNGDRENRLNHYLNIIENDIPRTFPSNDFVNKTSSDIKELLHTFCLYSPVGYIQGHNFIASACVYFFNAKTPYLSFYLFLALFDNVKDVFLLQIDASFAAGDNVTFAPMVESCMSMFLDFYKNKYPERKISEMVILALKNFVQWRIFGTLTLSCQSNIKTTTHIIAYFLPCLYDRTEFKKKLTALALSFLLCCFLDKPLVEEVVLLVQNGSLNEDGLLCILHSAKSTIKLLDK